ncbi:hypothetical protein Tco_1338931 [Tanacetum coccineum]
MRNWFQLMSKNLYATILEPVTYDLTSKTYFFTLDDQIFEVNADLLCDALRITPKVSDRPFTQPPPEEEIISFIIQLGYSDSLTKGRLQVLTDQALLLFKFYGEWSQVKMLTLPNSSGRTSSSKLNLEKSIDASLGTLKFTNKGEKDLVFGMLIPTVMLSGEIKASEDYLNYLDKSTRTQPVKVKGKGKGLLTKKGVEVVVETVRIPKKRHSETVIEETGQLKEAADTVD